MQRVNLPDRSTSTHHLAGSNLLFARIAWIALVGITVLLFILSIQPHFDSLMAQAASELSAGSTGIITPQNIALYYLLLDVFMALAYAAIAVRIFWGKASNWYAMFVSAMLITFGIGVANSTIYALLRTQHFLLPLVFVVSIIGTVLFVIFIYTLPDGRFAPRWTAVVPVLWAVVSVAVYALPVTCPRCLYHPLS